MVKMVKMVKIPVRIVKRDKKNRVKEWKIIGRRRLNFWIILRNYIMMKGFIRNNIEFIILFQCNLLEVFIEFGKINNYMDISKSSNLFQ